MVKIINELLCFVFDSQPSKQYRVGLVPSRKNQTLDYECGQNLTQYVLVSSGLHQSHSVIA